MPTLLDSLKIAVRQFRGVASNSERLSDRQLLQRFTLNRDESAFAALLERHGGMVLGVCRRVLGCPQTADDAFQATFLVLLKKAASLAWRESVGSWLHEVAYRVACKARVSQQRQRARERLAASMNPEHQTIDNDRRELVLALDVELALLPEKYRQPIVLCYLEGRSHEEAAAELGWPVGTVKGRLARGRDVLRKRLVRRGIAPGTAALTSMAGLGVGTAEVSAELAQATQELARVCCTGQACGCASASVLTLAEGMVRSMALRKLWHALIGVFALVVIGGGVGVLGRSMWGGEPGDDSTASSDKGSGSDKDSRASAEAEAKVNHNLKDRREMLLKAFNLRMEQFRAGKVTPDPLKDDLRALVKVSAELYSDKKERVAGLEECIKLATHLVKVTDAKTMAGLATEADGLEVKVLLLEIQAKLLREQNRTAAAADKDRLIYENTRKIKPRTTTYKEVVALLGEPASKNTTKDGKVSSAKWISGEKSFTVNFEDEVVRSTMSHAIPVPKNPKLTNANVQKIKLGTTTFKQVVELIGEPTATGTTKEGKLKSALWISDLSRVNISFDEDGIVRHMSIKLQQVPLQKEP